MILIVLKMHMFQTVNSNYLWGEVSGLKVDEMNRRLPVQPCNPVFKISQ